jgi:hypothetical protein
MHDCKLTRKVKFTEENMWIEERGSNSAENYIMRSFTIFTPYQTFSE